jgi:predicted dithiol-disulfide oxidoreductase (DUF899 family)
MTMSLPDVTAREEWVEARKRLLVREKELTRLRDELNADRRRLPMVKVETDYVFTGPDGEVSLLDLFGDHRQLVVQHVMYDPGWDKACPSCTASLDEMGDGVRTHLSARATNFVLISRAPFPKLQEYARDRGWTVPWYSSSGSDFNYDYHVSLDASIAPVQYNYRDAAELEAHGAGWMLKEPAEMPGYSCFLRVGDDVYHTYSAFARGAEQADGSYGILDMTALGRQEAWEEPTGRADDPHGADPSFG